jgi:hypothetical protein
MPERPTCGTCPYAVDYPTGLYCYRMPSVHSVSMWRDKDGDLETWQHTEQPTVASDTPACGEHPDFPAYIQTLKTEVIDRITAERNESIRKQIESIRQTPSS